MNTTRLFLLLSLGASITPAGASTILPSSTADAAATFNSGTGNYVALRQNDAGINIGRQGSGGVFHQAMVVPFQLPDLGVIANPFETATFTFRHNSNTNIVGSSPAIDLYGLPPRAAATVLPTSASTTQVGDYFMGVSGSDDDTPGVVKLQDDIITSSSTPANMVTTDVSGSAALLDYLNTSYDAGAGVGQWVFLRLSLDGTPGGVSYYNVATANNATEANRPFITYTAIPEPGTALLGLLGGLALLRRRRP